MVSVSSCVDCRVESTKHDRLAEQMQDRQVSCARHLEIYYLLPCTADAVTAIGVQEEQAMLNQQLQHLIAHARQWVTAAECQQLQNQVAMLLRVPEETDKVLC